jgi:hypothetical protein
MIHAHRLNRPVTISAPRPPQAQRQLSMSFESPAIQDMDPNDRAKAVAQLASLLLQAAGVAAGGDDDVEL